uniref:Uncharacterized protein n=1 Tax=Mycena chlorophos TaxID=658473 RepID=A0ABQ0LE73_MYCCL|nr:predicted protein [Mycena chlorophos]
MLEGIFAVSYPPDDLSTDYSPPIVTHVGIFAIGARGRYGMLRPIAPSCGVGRKPDVCLHRGSVMIDADEMGRWEVICFRCQLRLRMLRRILHGADGAKHGSIERSQIRIVRPASECSTTNALARSEWQDRTNCALCWLPGISSPDRSQPNASGKNVYSRLGAWTGSISGPDPEKWAHSQRLPASLALARRREGVSCRLAERTRQRADHRRLPEKTARKLAALQSIGQRRCPPLVRLDIRIRLQRDGMLKATLESPVGSAGTLRLKIWRAIGASGGFDGGRSATAHAPVADPQVDQCPGPNCGLAVVGAVPTFILGASDRRKRLFSTQYGAYLALDAVEDDDLELAAEWGLNGLL